MSSTRVFSWGVILATLLVFLRRIGSGSKRMSKIAKGATSQVWIFRLPEASVHEALSQEYRDVNYYIQRLL